MINLSANSDGNPSSTTKLHFHLCIKQYIYIFTYE